MNSKFGLTGVSMLFVLAMLAACGGGGGGGGAATLAPLNDTGQTLCYDNTVAIACPASTFPRQDALFGRDAQATAGTLVKTGAGAAGFDYTKVCMNGTLNCIGAASNAAAPAAGEWACTKDNRTNLIWSLQAGNDTWDNAASAANALVAPNHFSNANAAARCGFSTGWRLPTRRELLSIVHSGTSSPSIDTGNFPGTSVSSYWSSDTYAPSTANAWYVTIFFGGNTFADFKTISSAVRLVRSGQ